MGALQKQRVSLHGQLIRSPGTGNSDQPPPSTGIRGLHGKRWGESTMLIAWQDGGGELSFFAQVTLPFHRSDVPLDVCKMMSL